MKISLCLLVWNELEGCRIDVPKLPRDAFHEIYAVDGGSSDGTVEFLASQGIPVYRQAKKGLNAAYHHAVEQCSADAIVIFFPKGTIDPATVLNFRPLLESGEDLVIASRKIEGARNEEDDRFLKVRKWGVLGLAGFVSLLWRTEGYLIRDVLHGYKGFTLQAFYRMRLRDYGLSIDLEMAVRAYRLHLRRAEFAVQELSRPFGETRFKILPTGTKLLRYLIWEMMYGLAHLDKGDKKSVLLPRQR